jgi:predicted RNA methylase
MMRRGDIVAKAVDAMPDAATDAARGAPVVAAHEPDKRRADIASARAEYLRLSSILAAMKRDIDAAQRELDDEK